MARYWVGVLFLAACAAAQSSLEKFVIYPFPFIVREVWEAKPPLSITYLNAPAQYVVIYHTYIPGICLTRDECLQSMQSMQNTHQNVNGWSDIGYNFAIGGEGSAHEGRGWNVVGGHETTVRLESVNIAIIGDYTTQLPPSRALDTTKQLIAEGVRRGYISADYRLIGHRQVAETDSPGDALFEEIKTWDRFTPSENEDRYPFSFVPRETWGANPPHFVTNMAGPALYVVICHTYIPGICLTRDDCMQQMRNMQSAHQNNNGWPDIAYNFAIGGEGSAYEGRSWGVIVSSSNAIRSQSLDIAIIGDYRTQLPPAVALETTKQLIAEGVRRGHIRADYRLVGHRQVVATESPGDALFREIQTWDRFTHNVNEDPYPLSFVSREAWGANPPRSVTNMAGPALYVVICHTYIPGICLTRNECMQQMRNMQSAHQNNNGWPDIAYNFAIGGEGSAYEGRSWGVVVSQTNAIRSLSLDIAIIGDYRTQLPPAVALEATKQLIAEGVRRGHIRADYRLVGHRQVVATESPGDALFREIQTWDNFTPNI